MQADEFKALRMRLFLTQADVARLAGCTAAAICQMESGRNCVQSYAVTALAKAATGVEERRRACIRSAMKKLTPMERVALGVELWRED